MLRNIFCWKGFGPVTGPPSFPVANFQQMVIARLSLGLSFLGLRNFLKLCHDEKPCTWWLGEKGLGSLQSRLARMLHHEYDALKGYRFLGGAISFYSVSCMSDVIFNPSLLNWSSLILTVAHMSSHLMGSWEGLKSCGKIMDSKSLHVLWDMFYSSLEVEVGSVRCQQLLTLTQVSPGKTNGWNRASTNEKSLGNMRNRFLFPPGAQIFRCNVASWCFQPIWKILVKNGFIFPR